MIDIIKSYFKRADDLPKKERILEKTLICLEITILIAFILELLNVIPFNIGNYIIIPLLIIYIILNVIKNFKKSVLLSIMMVISMAILIYLMINGGF